MEVVAAASQDKRTFDDDLQIGPVIFEPESEGKVRVRGKGKGKGKLEGQGQGTRKGKR
jgi:hypothetical protein